MYGNIGLFNEQIVSDGRKIWYIEYNSKLLMEMEVMSCKLKVLGEIPGLNCINNAYRFFLYANDKLVFLPFESNVFLVYDIKDHNYDKYEINFELTLTEKKLHLFGGVLSGDCIYAFGKHPFIVKFNYLTGEMSVNLKISRYVLDYSEKDIWFNKVYCVYDGHLFLPICKRNMIIDYDFQKDSINCVVFEKRGKAAFISGIAADGNFLWVLFSSPDKRTELCKMAYENKNMEVVKNVDMLGTANERDLPYYIYKFKNDILFLPCQVFGDTSVRVFNTLTAECHIKEEVPILGEGDDNVKIRNDGVHLYGDIYSSVVIVEDSLIVINPWTGQRVIWNLRAPDVVCNDIKIDNYVLRRIIDKMVQEGQCVNELELSLEAFLKIV